ncbi:hypothetical protein KAW80_04605 [Candidatus Babeliales bacterium]|nr:hypothetical protein [Candidatus Babeliales bacterium]
MNLFFIFLFFISSLYPEGAVLPAKDLDLSRIPSFISDLRRNERLRQNIEKNEVVEKRSNREKMIQHKEPASRLVISSEIRKILDAHYYSPELLGTSISLSLKIANIEDVIELLAKTSKINFVIDSDVSGKIKNINLKDVPVGHALKAVLSNNSSELALKKEFGIYRILRLDKAAKILNSKLEELKRNNFKKIAITLQSAIFNYEFKKRVRKMWRGVVGKDYKTDGTYLVFDDESKKVFIKGRPNQIDDMLSYIKEIDVRFPQVKIEARMVIAKKDFDESLGLQLSGIYNKRSSIGRGSGFVGAGPLSNIRNKSAEQPSSSLMDWALNLFPDSALTSKKINLPFVFGGNDLNTKRLNIILNAAENKGELKTILKPSILTTHGEESTLSVCESVPIETIVKESVEGTLRDVTTATYKDVGTILKVKPFVSPDKKLISLDVFVENSSHINQNKFPLISSATTKCSVRLKNGQTAMIGGLIEKTKSKNSTSVPVLGEIPILGNLFKGSNKEGKDHQLLIFITSTIT